MREQSDNSETFVGLCLLTVAGAALLTESLGFSDTMGAFVAGVLLSESSYKTQVRGRRWGWLKRCAWPLYGVGVCGKDGDRDAVFTFSEQNGVARALRALCLCAT